MFLLRWFTNALLVILVTYVVPEFLLHPSDRSPGRPRAWYPQCYCPSNPDYSHPANHPRHLGIFTFVINGVLFWLVSTVIKGFNVDGF